MTYPNGNGFTQKEMLNLILEGQQDINKRIDELHEKVNQKISFFSDENQIIKKIIIYLDFKTILIVNL